MPGTPDVAHAVRPLDEAYRAYVHAHAEATLWHDADFLAALVPPGERGAWLYVAAERDGELVAVWPHYVKRRLDGRVVTVPPLARYADPLGGDAAFAKTGLAALTQGRAAVTLLLSPGQQLAGEHLPARTHLRERTTYLASTAGGVAGMRTRVSKRMRRTLRKAGDHWTVAEVERLGTRELRILAEPFRRQGIAQPYADEVVARVAALLQPRGQLVAQVLLDPAGEAQAVGVALLDARRGYMWLNGSTDAARTHHGGTYVYWTNFLACAARGVPVIDCLGSELAGPAENRRQLGARPVGYLQVEGRYSWLARLRK